MIPLWKKSRPIYHLNRKPTIRLTDSNTSAALLPTATYHLFSTISISPLSGSIASNMQVDPSLFATLISLSSVCSVYPIEKEWWKWWTVREQQLFIRGSTAKRLEISGMDCTLPFRVVHQTSYVSCCAFAILLEEDTHELTHYFLPCTSTRMSPSLSCAWLLLTIWVSAS
jgi:hypothetical protein